MFKNFSTHLISQPLSESQIQKFKNVYGKNTKIPSYGSNTLTSKKLLKLRSTSWILDNLILMKNNFEITIDFHLSNTINSNILTSNRYLISRAFECAKEEEILSLFKSLQYDVNRDNLLQHTCIKSYCIVPSFVVQKTNVDDLNLLYIKNIFFIHIALKYKKAKVLFDEIDKLC